MKILKSKYAKIFCVLLLSIIFSTCQAYADATYTYYPSGRVKSITYSPAENGVTYVEYLDEDWCGTGLGRIYKKVLSVADDDGAISYVYSDYVPGNSGACVDLDCDNYLDEFVYDFGDTYGLYTYSETGGWVQLNSVDPDNMITADLDGDGISDDLICDFGDLYGLYTYSETSGWVQLNPIDPDNMITADLDGDGFSDDLICDFGDTYGLYTYSETSGWVQLNSVDPDNMITADLDGDGISDDLICDFGDTYGLYTYSETGGWVQLNSVDPDNMITADLDGDGISDDLICDFGDLYGLYTYSETSGWVQLNPIDPDNMITADLDGDGILDDLICDFGDTYGLYTYSETGGWVQLNSVDPDNMITADLDGDGILDDLICDFGDLYGLYTYSETSGWVQLNPIDPDNMITADLDGDGFSDDLICDFGSAYGLWKYTNNTTWERITTAGQDNSYMQYGYSSADFSGLVFTAEYAASGNLIDKIYETPSDQIENYLSGLLMRKIEGATGNVFEYENDNNYYHNGSYGRPLLESSHNETVLGGAYATSSWYKSYEWEGPVVEIGEYDGEYTVDIEDPVKAGLYTTEERVHYTYFHNGEYSTALAESSWDMAAMGIYNESGGYDENLIEGYMWYAGDGYTPGDDYLMKAYNQATGYGTEWEDPGTGHKVITVSTYTTETSFLEGGYEVTNYYQTFDWDAEQVLVSIYDGVYAISSDYSTRTGVVDAELRVSYLYDHNDVTWDLDPSSNEWDMREKIIYDTDGFTMLEKREFDSEGNLIGLTEYDATYRQETYSYYSYDGLVFKGMYKYDNNGNLIAIYGFSELEEPNNIDGKVSLRALYEYDESGRIKTIMNYDYKGDLSLKRIYEYDESGNLVTVDEINASEDIDAFMWPLYPREWYPGLYFPETTSCGYCSSNEGSVRAFYDEAGNIVSRDVHEYEYSGVDRTVIRNYNTLGELVSTAYNQYGEDINYAGIHDRLVMEYYDAASEFIWKTLYEYDVDGKRTGLYGYDAQDTLRSSASYYYDADGNRTYISWGDFSDNPHFLYYTESRVYDSGRMVAKYGYMNDELVLRNEYEYDGDGNLIEIYGYDAGDNRVLIQETSYDADGNIITQKGYDFEGNLVRDRANEYDVDGNLISSTYSSTNSWSVNGSLEMGLPSQTNYAAEYEYIDGILATASWGSTIFAYDENGYTTEGWSYESIHEYDTESNEISSHYSSTTYWYDELGNLTGTDGFVSDNIYEYDANGRLIKQYTYDGEEVLESITTYVYDACGNCVGELYDWDADGDIDSTEEFGYSNSLVSYTYYVPSGKMHTKTTIDGTLFEYEDEEWNGHDYGRLLKETTWYGFYKTYEKESYYDGTDQARYVREYDSNDNLLAFYEYSSDGHLLVKETYEGSTGAWLETCWFNNDENNRLYQKHDYDGASYQYADYGQGIDDVDGYFLEMKWEPSGKHVYGYSGEYSTSPLLEWEQYSGVYTTGRTLTTYEYYETPDEDQYHWKNIYAWDGVDTDYMLSYEYSTNGSYMGEYTTGHTPGEVFALPEHDPAKPEHTMNTVEYYQGTGNIRTYYDSYNGTVYTFEDLDYYNLLQTGAEHGQGRLTGVRFSDGDAYTYSYWDNTLSVREMDSVRYDGWKKTSEETRLFLDEDFYHMPGMAQFGDGSFVLTGSAVEGDFLRRYVIKYGNLGQYAWSTFFSGYNSCVMGSAVDIDGAGDVIAVTSEYSTAPGVQGARLCRLDGVTGAELGTAWWNDNGGLEEDFYINDVAIDASGNIYVVGNYGEYPNSDIWMVMFNSDLSYAGHVTYDSGGDDQGYTLEFNGSNIIIHGAVAPVGQWSESYYLEYDEFGTLVNEGYDIMARENLWWLGVYSSGRLYIEDETESEYDELEYYEQYDEVLAYIEGTGIFAEEYCNIEEMEDHGDALNFYYYNNGIYTTETNTRIIFDDGLVCEVAFQGSGDEENVIVTKVLEPTGNTSWFLWGIVYNGQPNKDIAIEHTYDGEWNAYELSNINSPTDLFDKENNWTPTAWDGSYTTGNLPELGGWPSGITVEYPELPQQFHADSGRVRTCSDSSLVYYYLDEDFYNPEEYPYIPEYHEGRVERILVRGAGELSNDGLYMYGYFDDSTDRPEYEYTLLYDQSCGYELNFTYTRFYNESYYEGPGPSIYSDVAVQDGYGRMYTAMHGRQMTEEYVKRYAYVAGEDMVLIEYTTEYEEMEPGVAYYYWDEYFSQIEYVRFEFDSGAIGEGIVDYYQYENGWDISVRPTKGDFTGVDPVEYPEYSMQAGKTYWFFWEWYDINGNEMLDEGEDYVVLEYDNVSTWNAYTFNPSAPLDGAQWTPWGSITAPDPADLAAIELGNWWQWVADNQLPVEFPPLSTEFIDDGSDSIIDRRIDYNDMFNTIIEFSWDDPAPGQMTADMYLDTNRDGDHGDDEDLWVYHIEYDTGGDTDINNIGDWPAVGTYKYTTGPAALYAPDPMSSLDVETGDEMEEFMNNITEMELIYSGAGITAALLDTGMEDGGHAADTAAVMTSVAGGVNLLSLDVFGSFLQATPSLVSGAIRYAADLGARIIAMPFTMALVPDVVKDAIGYAVEKGSVLIAAAGNTGSEIDDKSLAAQEGVITVGSVDNDGKLSAWSNYGDEVDLYAPWDVIENQQGTSFSAAFVAGIAALIMEDNPEMTANEVLSQLRALMEDLGKEDKEEIKGVDISELLSKQKAIEKNQEEFTGYGVEEELYAPDKQ